MNTKMVQLCMTKKLLFFLAIVLLLVMLLGCQLGKTPPLPGAPGTTPIGQAYYGLYVPPQYAPPVDVFENNAPLFILSQDQFLSIPPIGSASFTAQAKYNTTDFAAFPYNLIFKLGYVYEPTSACKTATDGCSFAEGKCCSGWRAFSWSGNTVSIGGNQQLVADVVSPWVNYSTAPKAFTLNAGKLQPGLNFVLAYSCKRVAQQWKCGCSNQEDTSCDKWMIQIFNVTLTETCADNAKNQDETDIDCGGICAQQGKKCSQNLGCLADTDCVTDKCDALTKKCATPVTCSDGVKNGQESDVDCGGPCPKCGETKNCTINGDCATNNCDAATKKCTPQVVATCSDTQKNQDETDIDCGGICATAAQGNKKCTEGKICSTAGDCATNTCDATTKKCIQQPLPDLLVKNIIYGSLQGNNLPIMIKIQNIGTATATQPIEVNYTIADNKTGEVKKFDSITISEDILPVASTSLQAIELPTITIPLGSSTNIITHVWIDPLLKKTENNRANNYKNESVDLGLGIPPSIGG